MTPDQLNRFDALIDQKADTFTDEDEKEFRDMVSKAFSRGKL